MITEPIARLLRRKSKTLPVVGQAVTVICPSGTPESGIVIPGHFTDDNPKPDSDDDDYVRMNGDGAVSRMKCKTIEHKIGDKVSVLLERTRSRSRSATTRRSSSKSTRSH